MQDPSVLENLGGFIYVLMFEPFTQFPSWKNVHISRTLWVHYMELQRLRWIRMSEIVDCLHCEACGYMFHGNEERALVFSEEYRLELCFDDCKFTGT